MLPLQRTVLKGTGRCKTQPSKHALTSLSSALAHNVWLLQSAALTFIDTETISQTHHICFYTSQLRVSATSVQPTSHSTRLQREIICMEDMDEISASQQKLQIQIYMSVGLQDALAGSVLKQTALPVTDFLESLATY